MCKVYVDKRVHRSLFHLFLCPQFWQSVAPKLRMYAREICYFKTHAITECGEVIVEAISTLSCSSFFPLLFPITALLVVLLFW